MFTCKTLLALSFAFLALPAAGAELPALRTGDLVFQTSLSRQSKVIQRATGSRYSHVGIVEVSPNGQASVIEAFSRVSRIAVKDWVRRGSQGKFAVFRLVDIAPAKLGSFLSAAKAYLGRPYDIYFTRGNQEIYCSELVDFAARDAGLEIGRYQKFGTLDVSNEEVMGLARVRWQGHPRCQGLPSFEECWPRLLGDEMVTPVSLTEDARVRLVYSNY